MSTSQFRVRPGEKVKLAKRPTKVERFYKSKPHYRELLGQRVVELQELQDKLYASNTYSVLFVLQAMDAAGYWKDYAKDYEDCMSATSTRDSPWFVVPADDEQNARLIVSRIVLDTLADLKLAYPKVDDKQRKELAGFRKLLK